ncbi:MAG: hypothetical protein AB7P08_18650 [Burkholderiales bacterium]
MSSRRPVAASWVDTGRLRLARSAPDPLRDLVEFFGALRAGKAPPPLLTHKYAGVVDELVAGLMRGERMNLHSMLGLPDKRWAEVRRRVIERERALCIRAIAAALPQELGPWQRAERVIALLTDRSIPCPPGAIGEVATLRAGILGKPPRTARAIHYVLTAPT